MPFGVDEFCGNNVCSAGAGETGNVRRRELIPMSQGSHCRSDGEASGAARVRSRLSLLDCRQSAVQAGLGVTGIKLPTVRDVLDQILSGDALHVLAP